jgi:hypothetical protein
MEDLAEVLTVYVTALAAERRAYGWGFLSGDGGAAAEAAFAALARAVDARVPAT